MDHLGSQSSERLGKVFLAQSLPEAFYVHFPFCAKKCPFCDFYSGILTPFRQDFSLYLTKEIALYEQHFLKIAEQTGQRATFRTLFFGGGTPSLFEQKELAQVMDSIFLSPAWQWDLVENTMEVNPEDVTEEKLLFWKSLGVNRISLGVQSFQEEVLRFLGRNHTVKDVWLALERVEKIFPNYSFDILVAVPGQEEEKDLEQVRKISPPHVSLYELTYYEKTPFYYQIPENMRREMTAEEFLSRSAILESQGYEHYEISNFAKSGKKSFHNLYYWRREPYLAVGPSASGYTHRIRYKNKFMPEYQNDLKQGKFPYMEEEIMNTQEDFVEKFLLTGRTHEEFSLNQEEQNLLGELLPQWIKEGYLTKEKVSSRTDSEGKVADYFRLEKKGWLVLDALVEKVYENIQDNIIKEGR